MVIRLAALDSRQIQISVIKRIVGDGCSVGRLASGRSANHEKPASAGVEGGQKSIQTSLIIGRTQPQSLCLPMTSL